MSETKTLSDQQVAHNSQAPVGRAGTSFHEAGIGTTIPSQPSRSRQILRFLRHFGEMILAMLLGMVALSDLLKARVRNLEEERRRERVLPLHLVFPLGARRSKGSQVN